MTEYESKYDDKHVEMIEMQPYILSDHMEKQGDNFTSLIGRHSMVLIFSLIKRDTAVNRIRTDVSWLEDNNIR